MSNLVVPDIAEEDMLEAVMSVFNPNIDLRLFKNNYTPIPASTYANFTEADFTGYARITVTLGSLASVGGKAQVTDGTVRKFIMGVPGTGNTIYGYYVVNSPTGPGSERIAWAERFDSPQVLANHFDEIDITLVLTLFSEF